MLHLVFIYCLLLKPLLHLPQKELNDWAKIAGFRKHFYSFVSLFLFDLFFDSLLKKGTFEDMLRF